MALHVFGHSAWWRILFLTTIGSAIISFDALAGTEPKYIIAGRLWNEAELRESYARIHHAYVVDPDSRMIRRAKELKAFALKGILESRASDRRIIVKSKRGLFAVQCRDIFIGETGTTVDIMVRKSGTPFYSHETATDNRQRLPQVVDVTLSFKEFSQSLQRGDHYPELPEFGLKENP